MSHSTGFIVGSIAAHPPVNKGHMMHTFPNFTTTAPLPLQNLMTVFPGGHAV